LLADASISRADVSKAKPPAPRPAIRHTHAGRRPQRGPGNRGGGGGATYRLKEAASEEEGRGPPPRRRVGGHRREEGQRARAAEEGSRPGGRRRRRVGEGLRVEDGDARRGRGGRTSARPSLPAVGDDAAHVSGRSGAARRRRGARRGRTW
jgi:hypothetical protein